MVRQIVGEWANRRDQPAFISESQRGPEGAHAAAEVPDYVAVISRPIL
jgi:hypothetical protein